jgi:hypothetical protein
MSSVVGCISGSSGGANFANTRNVAAICSKLASGIFRTARE